MTMTMSEQHFAAQVQPGRRSRAWTAPNNDAQHSASGFTHHKERVMTGNANKNAWNRRLTRGDSALRRLFDGLVLAGVGESRFCSLNRAEGVDSVVDTGQRNTVKSAMLDRVSLETMSEKQ